MPTRSTKRGGKKGKKNVVPKKTAQHLRKTAKVNSKKGSPGHECKEWRANADDTIRRGKVHLEVLM